MTNLEATLLLLLAAGPMPGDGDHPGRRPDGLALDEIVFLPEPEVWLVRYITRFYASAAHPAAGHWRRMTTGERRAAMLCAVDRLMSMVEEDSNNG